MSDVGTNGDSLHCHVGLSDVAVAALKELSAEEAHLRDSYRNDAPPFPGACGSGGTTLVRRGLAVRLGPHTYGSERHGCTPWRFVRYKLTDKGVAEAERRGFLKPNKEVSVKR